MGSVLESKVIVIAGAGTGIGAACALDLAGAGARVVLVGRRATLLEEQVAKIAATGGETWALSADVREWAQVESIVARTVERYGSAGHLHRERSAARSGPHRSGRP